MQVTSKDKLGSTLGVFFSSFPKGDTSGNYVSNFVDVRDAALVQVESLTTEAAGGERIIAANGK